MMNQPRGLVQVGAQILYSPIVLKGNENQFPAKALVAQRRPQSFECCSFFACFSLRLCVFAGDYR
jgi:hypothetical protein